MGRVVGKRDSPFSINTQNRFKVMDRIEKTSIPRIPDHDDIVLVVIRACNYFEAIFAEVCATDFFVCIYGKKQPSGVRVVDAGNAIFGSYQ